MVEERYMTLHEQLYKTIKDQIKEQEGCVLHVYADTLGIPTVGYGHKVLPDDDLKIGDTITIERADELFNQDIAPVVYAALKQAEQIGQLELYFLQALVQVNYQLGVNWTKAWPNTWGKLIEGNYDDAIRAIERSRWMRQTPKRARAFIAALEKARDEEADDKWKSINL